jgi:prophage antirepressor-like protein
MNNDNQHPIQAFAFDSHAVRVVMIDDAHWFIAKDVCNCLEITNYRNAITKLDNDERDVQSLDTLGGMQEMAVINESGLYTLILRSQGATTPGTPAHTFRKWVTSEVLPSIRKTGSYAPPNSLDSRLDRVIALMEQTLAITSTILKPKPKRVHRPIMPEDIARARELFAQGFSQNEIARQLQRSSGSISWMVKEA